MEVSALARQCRTPWIRCGRCHATTGPTPSGRVSAACSCSSSLARRSIATTVLAAIGRASESFGIVGKAGIVVVSVLINAGVCLVVFRIATARDVTYRQVAPGALAAAVIWQLLQWFGAIYVAQVVKSSSATNSVFALVLGLLAFLYLIATTLLLCAEANVVATDRLYPRALLTPFTDNVDLTRGDRKTYTGQAKAQRAKGFQRIDVTFDDHQSKDTQP